MLQNGKFTLCGEGLNIGRDGGAAVTDDYPFERPWALVGGDDRARARRRLRRGVPRRGEGSDRDHEPRLSQPRSRNAKGGGHVPPPARSRRRRGPGNDRHVERNRSRDDHRCAAGLPPAGEADRRGLQPRLLLLLLPLQGDALSGLAVPDGRRAARGLPAAADRGARPRARGADRLAGRRADADGARLLPPLGRARGAAPAAGAARGVHDPDERHAARRGVGRVLRRARLPGRDLDRRPARDPRRLPREQGRQGHVRPGHARAPAPARRRRGVERADHDPRRQRRPRARGLPLPARRVRRPLRPVHPDRRARDARPTRTARCPGARGATGRSTCRTAIA